MVVGKCPYPDRNFPSLICQEKMGSKFGGSKKREKLKKIPCGDDIANDERICEII
jgi:hypothetical protein